MCGRVGLGKEERYAIDARYSLPLSALRVRARYNAPPTALLPVLINDGGEIRAKVMRWGLVPSWSTRTNGFSNARGETLTERPAFRDAFRLRRGVTIVDHFFEWERQDGQTRQPWLFQHAHGKPLLMATLWEPGRDIDTTTIVTVRANEFMRPVHDRMPVLLDESDLGTWMDNGTSAQVIRSLIQPAPDSLLVRIPVSEKVSTGIDDASVCEPVRIINDLRLAL